MHLLDKYKPDIVVIQECENPDKSDDYKSVFYNWADLIIWKGVEENKKGVGVFAFNDNNIATLDWGHFEYDYFFLVVLTSLLI